jgi:hypothetical protein
MKTLIIGLGKIGAIHGWALSQAIQKPEKCGCRQSLPAARPLEQLDGP